MKALEERFHEEMIDIYYKAREKCNNYTATRFLEMVRKQGGLQAAKSLLKSQDVSYGLMKLWECGCLGISMEALVLTEPFTELFSEDEKRIARERLEQLGYKVE